MPSTIISIHWVESLPDNPTIYINGDTFPDSIVHKLIDKIADYNTPVENLVAEN
jgi:hypothetical protein